MKKYFVLLIVLLVGISINSGCKKSSVAETPQLNPPKILNFTASPSTISYRESSQLSWEVTGATSVIADWSGAVGQTDSRTVTPEASKTYTITATNSDGTVTRSVEVNVKKQANMILIESSTYEGYYPGTGNCFIAGVVVNDGNHPCWNVKFEFDAYDSNGALLDTAKAFPNDLGEIQAGEQVIIEAIFFYVYKWKKIANIKYIATWINSDGATVRKEGIINVR